MNAKPIEPSSILSMILSATLRNFGILLAITCLMAIPAFGQVSSGSSTGASLDETLTWLKDKLEVWTSVEFTSKQGGDDSVIYCQVHPVMLSVEPSGTIILRSGMSLSKRPGGLDSISNSRSQVKLNLADIESVTFEPLKSEPTVDYGDHAYFKVILRSSKKVIEQSLWEHHRETVDWTPINVVDKSSAERIANAFRHAIELRKKKELF